MTKVSARLLGVLTALAMSLSIVSGNPAWAAGTLDNYIEVSPATIDFGTVMQIDLGEVGRTSVYVLNGTNFTDSPTSINVTANSNDYFDVKLLSPTSVVSPNTGAAFGIKPRSTLSPGTYEVPITFTCTTETESVQKSITARIVVTENFPDAADITFSPESVEFKVMEGYDSDAEAQTLTFTNNSAGDVEITDISNYGKTFQYDIERVSSSPVIPAGGTAEFRIKPKSGYETLGITMAEDSTVLFKVKDANENISAKFVPVRMTLYEYEDTFFGLAITPDTADFGKKRVGYQALEEKTFDISIGDGKFATIRKDELPHSENYTIRLWQGSLEYLSSNFTVSPGNNSKITIAPKPGLPPAEHDETIEVDFYDWLGKKTTKTINLKFTVLAKLPAPYITFPTASNITYGQTLADSTLTGGSTEYGTFAWDDASIVPGGGTASYGVTFTPSAETVQNYEPIPDANKKQDVSVAVAKATPEMTLDTTKNINKLTLTAVVKKVGKGDTPSGDVVFKYSVDNGATWEEIHGMSSYEPDADGNLVVAVSNWDFSVLDQKDTLISAEYSGDSNYKSKTITKEDFDSTLPPKHKVTFDLDGGTLLYYSTEREVYEGEPVYRPSPDPTKSGHNFEGWYADSGYQTPYTFGEAIMKATTIFAKFVKATYSLNSDVTPARGGIVTFSKDKASPGDEVTFKLALKDGYILKGMSCVDSNGEVVSIVPLNTVVDEWKFVMPEGNVTVRVTLGVPPKISLDNRQYTFEPEQVGYEVTGWLLVERVNNVGTVPVTISLDNDSDFGCWMLPDLGTTIQPGEIARMYCRQPRNLPVGTHTGEITITATSTEDSTLSVSQPFTMNFTVTEHKPDSIAIDGSNLTDLAYGDGPVTLSLRDPGKGSGAVTWTSSDPSVLSIDGTTATITGMGTATITATKADDGTYEGATNSIEVTVGKAKPEMTLDATKKVNKATLTATVKKVGSLDTPTGDVAFKYSLDNGATWESISGTLSYESDAGGNLVATLPDWDFSVLGEKDAWVLAEYSGDDNYKTAAISLEFDSTLPPKRTVTFDLDGGSFATSATTVTVYEGATVSDPTDYPDYDYPEKDGWRFDGWYTDDSYGTPFDFDVPIVADTTVHAKYMKTYKVNYDLHGGLIGGEAHAPGYVVDEGFSSEIPAWADLEGWFTMPVPNDEYLGVEIDGITYKPGDMYEVKSDITVNVLWKSNQRTAVWLNGDGSELDKATYMDGNPVPTTDKTPTKAADADYTYTFDAWDAGTVDGATITYKPVFTATAKPTDPSTPSSPSTPSTPASPSVPTDPSIPSTPSAPVSPSVPTSPSAPSTPTSPSVPTVMPTDLEPTSSLPVNTPSDGGTADNDGKPSNSGSPAPVQATARPLVNTGATVSVGSALALLLAGGLLLAYRRKLYS